MFGWENFGESMDGRAIWQQHFKQCHLNTKRFMRAITSWGEGVVSS